MPLKKPAMRKNLHCMASNGRASIKQAKGEIHLMPPQQKVDQKKALKAINDLREKAREKFLDEIKKCLDAAEAIVKAPAAENKTKNAPH